MHTEYEVRILEIDTPNIIQKLESIGAKKIGTFYQKRYVYDLKPREKGKWIRLRTNGTTTTLALKNVTKDTIDGTKEIEFELSDFDKANEFIRSVGFDNSKYQENKRIHYELNGTQIDIDTWPMIPTYLEIEASNEKEVLDMIKKLDLEKEKITTLNVDDVYRKIYGIELNDMQVLKFTEEEK